MNLIKMAEKVNSELNKIPEAVEFQKKYFENETKYLNKSIEEIDISAPQVKEFIAETKKESFIAQMNEFKRSFKKRHIMGGIALGVLILSTIYLIYINTVHSAFNMIGAVFSATISFVLLVQGIPIYITSLKLIKKYRENHIKITSKGMFNYAQYLKLMEKSSENEKNDSKSSDGNWQISYEQYQELVEELNELKKEKKEGTDGESTNKQP